MKAIGLLAPGFIAGTVVLSGCSSIPAGKPPQGEIVAQDETGKTYSSAAAVNYLITSLSTFAIKNIPKDSLVETKFSAADKSLNRYPEKVFKSAAAIARFSTAGQAGNYRLLSKINGNEILAWEMSLVRARDNAALWTETVRIDQGKQE